MRSPLFILIASVIITQNVTAQFCVSPEAENFYQQAMGQINPKHKDWIKTTSSKLIKERLDPDVLPGLVKSYSQQLNLPSNTIEGLLVLVMMEINKDSENDLRDALRKMQKHNEQKQQLRAAAGKLKQALKDRKEMLRSEYDSLKRLIDPPARITTNVTATVFEGKISTDEIKTLLDTARDKLDSLSEMGETESLRLQMAMDRMSKMMSTLSNILKKISDTSQSITQNLK